ncbi:hypothetical protein EDL98_10895 [Ornithobacterium rhinotracheale]|uniref:hypothetical protein n=1 Tax=Ornithobacterium rhinotracheale TaxID=28251 RepID=UPI00129CD457|nr:hypothetical protein [Ornithobacterium rhinotracheale]MRJ11571.1 hypothetical protein [Ornithobacterium rhinotracheale]
MTNKTQEMHQVKLKEITNKENVNFESLNNLLKSVRVKKILKNNIRYHSTTIDEIIKKDIDENFKNND